MRVQAVPIVATLRIPLKFHISLIILLDALYRDRGHLIPGIPYEPVLLSARSLPTFRRLLLIHGLHF